MVLRVGVIGTGRMGADHIRSLSTVVPRAGVSRIYDPDADAAQRLAAESGAEVAGSALALVESDDVDAVIVASPERFHTEQVLACLAVDKPVLCEKPMAAGAEDGWPIVAAEVARGRRLVQLGFMRRYDPGFVELRRQVATGAIGRPRLVHNVHRNASDAATTGAQLVAGSMIHEIDDVPWLLGGDPIAAIRVESPVLEGFQDPLLATFRHASGVLSSVEVFVNVRYGYDVHCEVVGTEGTVSLPGRGRVVTRVAGVDGLPTHDSFDTYFADAYRLELIDWVGQVHRGAITGPSSWDGYLANLIGDAGVRSLATGQWEQIVAPERPELFTDRVGPGLLST